ncbi:MAG: hypothetical protein LBN21_07945 [Treponema sp.]|jgi:hypothetical protein|nr:hypothetical protein [Treponema sp.]
MKKIIAQAAVAAAVLLLSITGCEAPSGAADDAFNYDPDLYRWSTASWTPFTVSAVSDSVSGITYGVVGTQERYVAVTRTGRIAWSNDGDVWNLAVTKPKERPEDPEPLDPFTVSFNAVAFGDLQGTPRFVAVGDDGKYSWSDDGKAWTASSSNMEGFGTTAIKGIAYGNGCFVVVGGNGNAANSTDGITWTDKHITALDTIQINAICYGEGKFFIAGDNGSVGYTANNGDSWQVQQATPPFTVEANRAICYAGKWSSDYTPAPDGIKIGIVSWDGRGIVVTDDFIWAMADSSKWDANLDKFAFDIDNKPVRGIAWGGGYYVASGVDARIGWWKDNDRANDRYWRALNYRNFRGWEVTCVSALNGRFFVGGIGGKIAYSGKGL